MSARILVADDEPDIVEPIRYALRNEGFEVDCVGDGEAALTRARSETYDLVILDVMMPKLSGMQVCRILRAETSVPILMLTAKDAEADRVLGLEFGADDYVTKPYSMVELVSRIRAILRRRELDRAERAGEALKLGGIGVDLTRHEVTVDGAPARLTPSEFKVLALLAEQPERVFTRRQIMEHLWESVFVGDERAADVHVSNLRHKLERDPSHPERIVTVRGVGYKLVAV
jgi:two-component system response regulator RegX3